MRKYSYVSLINTDSYLKGVLCLNESLKAVNSIYQLSVLITNDISEKSIQALKAFNINIIKMDNRIDVPGWIKERNVKLKMEHWNNSFDKLLMFELTMFEKIVFIDSDMYVIENIDNLFDKPNMSGVILGKSFDSDYYKEWTRTQFSSGLLVVEPKINSIDGLNKVFENIKKSDGAIGDQQVLWNYFYDWSSKKELHLSERYTVCFEHIDYYLKKLNYNMYNSNSYNNIAAIHFATPKPWLLDKKIRLKYLIYNLLNGEFKKFKLLNEYFRVLNNIERTIDKL